MAPLSFSTTPSEPSEIKTRCCSFVVVIVKLRPAGNSWLSPHFDMRTVLLYWMSHMRPSTCSNISSFLSLFHLMPKRIRRCRVRWSYWPEAWTDGFTSSVITYRVGQVREESRLRCTRDSGKLIFFSGKITSLYKQKYFSQMLIIVAQCNSRARNDCPRSNNSFYIRDERTFRSYCTRLFCLKI